MKSAILFGGTGLVGNNLLDLLIKNENYSKIKIFTRNEISYKNSKLEIYKIDFDQIKTYLKNISGNDCFFCIGTTKKNSPYKVEYKRIEHDMPIEIAKIAKSNSVNSFIYVSSGFANPKKSGDYLRFKGQVEEELKKLNFSTLGIMRPSFLLGNRKEKRIGEKIGIFLFKLLSPLFLGPLKKMKPIHSETVANAMIKVANENVQQSIFESDEIAYLNIN